MTASRLAVHTTLALLLSACGTTPARYQAPALVTSPGLVIGTLSYQYVELEAPAAPGLVVHFDRIDGASPEDYALPVNVDAGTRSGVFTGALPAGVYSFREVASAGRRYDAGALPMPFEVQAGAVQDAGHYALDPLRRPR